MIKQPKTVSELKKVLDDIHGDTPLAYLDDNGCLCCCTRELEVWLTTRHQGNRDGEYPVLVFK